MSIVGAEDQIVTKDYAIYQGDSCELIQAIPENSIHFGIHSPPFEGLYKFSNSERDISNNEGAAFWEHYGYLIKQLLRVTMPGRLHAVHVMQLPTSKVRHGHIGMRDFRGDVIRAYCNDEVSRLHDAIQAVTAKAVRLGFDGDDAGHARCMDLARRIRAEQETAADGGWILHSEICIWKDPVVAQQRTKSIRLLHKQIVTDSTVSGQGLADYIVIFRKPGPNPEPVTGMFDEFIGTGLDVSREAWERYVAENRAKGNTPWPFDMWVSVRVWQRYASPVWMDIDQTRTLQNRKCNPAAGDERDEQDEQHISPLQLDVIERCIELWSNPGDTVLTPFLGIGSEVWGAVTMGRKGIGIELKSSYFRQAAKNLAAIEKRKPTLFHAAE